MIPLVDSAGIYCRVCHFLPVKDADQDKLNTEHRTQSMDFGVVLEGEIELTLDDGAKKTMRKGDVVVQRGTIHVRGWDLMWRSTLLIECIQDWHNGSDEVCSMLFVLIPSDKVKVEKTGEILDPTAWPGPVED